MTFNTMHYKDYEEDYCGRDAKKVARRSEPVPKPLSRVLVIDSQYVPNFFTTGGGSNDGHVWGIMKRTYTADGRIKKVTWEADRD